MCFMMMKLSSHLMKLLHSLFLSYHQNWWYLMLWNPPWNPYWDWPYLSHACQVSTSSSSSLKSASQWKFIFLRIPHLDYSNSHGRPSTFQRPPDFHTMPILHLTYRSHRLENCSADHPMNYILSTPPYIKNSDLVGLEIAGTVCPGNSSQIPGDLLLHI